ncbi:MAG: putative quinol monooxygenase [Pirellulaceae bacterium]
MIYVIATIEVAAGKRDEFLKHFCALVPKVLEEDGCIEYGPNVDLDTSIAAQGELRKDVVVVIEKWEDAESLECHLVAPHMLEYRTQVKDLVQSVSLQILEPSIAAGAQTE